jgi:predicted DCC family thiol-disulfide oxidoreductase YuxK
MDHPVILFDGVCNLCSAAVQFVIKRDPKHHFRFASLQSETGQQLLQQHGLSAPYPDSIVLLEDGKSYARSAAVLRIAKKLQGLWPLMYGFMIIPAFIRDGMYNWIASKRYQWFGKKETCWIPNAELSSLFIN